MPILTRLLTVCTKSQTKNCQVKNWQRLKKKHNFLVLCFENWHFFRCIFLAHKYNSDVVEAYVVRTMPQDSADFLNAVFELVKPDKNAEILQVARTNISRSRNFANFSYQVMLAICGGRLAADMFEPCLEWVAKSQESVFMSDAEKAGFFFAWTYLASLFIT
jgi:hypothetical protein